MKDKYKVMTNKYIKYPTSVFELIPYCMDTLNQSTSDRDV